MLARPLRSRHSASRLPEFVQEGMVCYDLGAHNAGFYTLALARLVGPTGRVIAFEPLAENAANILHHLTINKIQQEARSSKPPLLDSDGLSSFAIHQSRLHGPACRRKEVRIAEWCQRRHWTTQSRYTVCCQRPRICEDGYRRRRNVGAARRPEAILKESPTHLSLSPFMARMFFEGCLHLLEAEWILRH